MHYSVRQLNLSYEVPFKKPVFSIAKNAIEVLSTFYDTISPRFPIGLTDLRSAPATTMADVSIRVSLFGGSGLLETGVSRFLARFERLQNDQDLAVVVDCIRLAESALSVAIPEMSRQGTRFIANSWLNCDGDPKDVQRFLQSSAGALRDIAPESFGADNVSHLQGAELVSSDEKWSMRIFLERSLIEGTQLYVQYEATYLEDGLYQNLEDQIKHLRALYESILARFQLVLRSN